MLFYFPKLFAVVHGMSYFLHRIIERDTHTYKFKGGLWDKSFRVVLPPYLKLRLALLGRNFLWNSGLKCCICSCSNTSFLQLDVICVYIDDTMEVKI